MPSLDTVASKLADLYPVQELIKLSRSTFSNFSKSSVANAIIF